MMIRSPPKQFKCHLSSITDTQRLPYKCTKILIFDPVSVWKRKMNYIYKDVGIEMRKTAKLRFPFGVLSFK